MRLPNPFRITRDESPVACVLNPVSCHELSIGFEFHDNYTTSWLFSPNTLIPPCASRCCLPEKPRPDFQVTIESDPMCSALWYHGHPPVICEVKSGLKDVSTLLSRR